LPWSERESDEFKRRSLHKVEFRAERPDITLVYPDGHTRVFSVALFKGVHYLQSETILLARRYVQLADTTLDRFTRAKSGQLVPALSVRVCSNPAICERPLLADSGHRVRAFPKASVTDARVARSTEICLILTAGIWFYCGLSARNWGKVLDTH